MRAIVLMLALMIAAPLVAQARVTPEVRPVVGMFVPTGDQHQFFRSSVLTGAEVALETAGPFHLVGSFTFTGPSFANQLREGGHMHVYQADVGGELFQNFAVQPQWKFRPFVGAGLGVRMYDPVGVGNGTRIEPAGYAALGSELQSNKVAFRVEARDYLSRYRGFSGTESSKTRNDLAVTAGLSFHLR
jgi:hypothetical protein